MSFLLYHPPTWSPRLLAHTLQAEQVELREVETPGEVRGEDRPTAYLLDPTARTHVTPQALTALRDQGVAVLALGEAGEDDVPAELPAELLSGFLRALIAAAAEHPKQAALGLVDRAGFLGPR